MLKNLSVNVCILCYCNDIAFHFTSTPVAVSMGNAVFGKGSGAIFQMTQQCVGLNCTLVVTSTSQCDHLDDLSLLCQPGERQEGEGMNVLYFFY